MTRNTQENQLVLQAQHGDQGAFERLINAYTPLVRARVHGYFLLGADIEDAMQEGMIGLFKAIRDYLPQSGSLRAFADVCIRRQVVDAIRTASRNKHRPLNQAVSFSTLLTADPAGGLWDITASSQTDPEATLLAQEGETLLEAKLAPVLSALEMQVLRLYLAGCGTADMARALDRTPKSIDNALQRIRKKVQAVLSEQ